MNWLPKTKIGKISFWLTCLGVVLMYIPYWIAMATQRSSPIFLSILSIALLIIFGTSSIVAIAKYKDRAVLLFIAALFGVLGWLLVLGEFIFPH